MALPRVAIEKLLRDVVPADVAIQKETIDWVGECAAEFLQLVGSRANTLAEESAKKENYRITSDHVLASIEALGKKEYNAAIQEQQSTHEVERQKKRQRVASRKAAAQDSSTQAELLAEQNALFQAATRKAAQEGW